VTAAKKQVQGPRKVIKEKKCKLDVMGGKTRLQVGAKTHKKEREPAVCFMSAHEIRFAHDPVLRVTRF